MTRYVAYLQVSTQRQGASGLGLAAQREAVARHAATIAVSIVAEVLETESGKRADRPELAQAQALALAQTLAACRAHKATLLIAKLDRLARDVAFIANLMKSGVPFTACDMPNATPFMLHVYAAITEEEGATPTCSLATPSRREPPLR